MKTILLADDEPFLRSLVRTTVEDPDWRVLEAGDGKEALRMARTEAPDLLVLDWKMPGMTGIEVSQALRSDPQTAEIPIIILTGSADELDEWANINPDALMVKPFSPLALIDKMRELLEREEVLR